MAAFLHEAKFLLCLFLNPQTLILATAAAAAAAILLRVISTSNVNKQRAHLVLSRGSAEFQSPEGKTLKPCLTLLERITNDTCSPNPPALQTAARKKKKIPRRSEELDLQPSVTVALLSYTDGCSLAPRNTFLFLFHFPKWYNKHRPLVCCSNTPLNNY